MGLLPRLLAKLRGWEKYQTHPSDRASQLPGGKSDILKVLVVSSIIIIISFIVNMAWDKNHLGVEATDRSLGGALDGGVDGEGGQMPVWMLVTMMMLIMPVWLVMLVMMMMMPVWLVMILTMMIMLVYSIIFCSASLSGWFLTMMTMMITNNSPPCVRSSHLTMLQKLDVAEEFVTHRFAKPPQIENVTLTWNVLSSPVVKGLTHLDWMFLLALEGSDPVEGVGQAGLQLGHLVLLLFTPGA